MMFLCKDIGVASRIRIQSCLETSPEPSQSFYLNIIPMEKRYIPAFPKAIVRSHCINFGSSILRSVPMTRTSFLFFTIKKGLFQRDYPLCCYFFLFPTPINIAKLQRGRLIHEHMHTLKIFATEKERDTETGILSEDKGTDETLSARLFNQTPSHVTMKRRDTNISSSDPQQKQ